MNENFETINQSIDQLSVAESIAQTGISLGTFALRMADTERVPRKPNGERENDAEHSYMLSLLAPAIANAHYPDLDRGLIAQFANVHDLVEVETGDVATFSSSTEELADKALREHAALQIVAAALDPYTRDLLLRYEEQVEPEARFVRMIDKLLPVIVDIVGQGIRVVREDYGVEKPWQLLESHNELHARFVRMFPEFATLLAAHERLTDQFEALFTKDFSLRAMEKSVPRGDQASQNVRMQPSANI